MFFPPLQTHEDILMITFLPCQQTHLLFTFFSFDGLFPMLRSCCVWKLSNMWSISKPGLSLSVLLPHILKQAAVHRQISQMNSGLLKNIRREEIGCLSSSDLGQGEAGMGAFSVYFRQEPLLLSLSHIYTQTQNRRGSMQLHCFLFFPPSVSE